jgi:hypothetical protein
MIDITLVISTFTILNILIFLPKYIINYKHFTNYEFTAMYASTIHSVFITIGIVLYIYNYITSIQTITQIFSISLGYYLSDLVYVLYSRINLMEYLIHHISIIYLICYTLSFNSINEVYWLYFCVEYLAYSLLAEIAVLPLNICWYYKNTGKSLKSIGFIIWCIILVVTYYFSRVINFTILFIHLIGLEYYGICAIALPIIILNYYWFIKICMMFHNKIKNN